MPKTVSERITGLRTALKMSQNDFARECEISTSLLSKVEIGQAEASDKFLLKISKRWDCPIEWLESGKGSIAYNAEKKGAENNIYADALYTELKDSNKYLQERLMKALDVISKLVEGGNLGKLNVLGFAERARKPRLSRTRVLISK